jgi:hypothetical protein
LFGNLIANANSYFNANTFTVGNSNITSNLNLFGNLIANSNAYVVGNANLSSNLIVLNNSYFSSNTFTTGNSNVTGNIAGNVIMSNAQVLRSVNSTVAFGSNTQIDAWLSNTYVSAEYNYYWTQTANTGNAQSGKILVSSINNNAYVTIYAVNGTVVNELVLFTASQSGFNVTVSANVINNNSNVSLKVSKSYLTV